MDKTYNTDIEETVIRTFIPGKYRARYLTLLQKEKRRSDFLEMLKYQFSMEADERFRLPASSDKNELLSELRKLGAPGKCYTVSSGDFDQRTLDLEAAMDLALNTATGTLLVCEPASLVYHRSEFLENSCLLHKRK